MDRLLKWNDKRDRADHETGDREQVFGDVRSSFYSGTDVDQVDNHGARGSESSSADDGSADDVSTLFSTVRLCFYRITGELYNSPVLARNASITMRVKFVSGDSSFHCLVLHFVMCGDNSALTPSRILPNRCNLHVIDFP